jgi:hypothetical protein
MMEPPKRKRTSSPTSINRRTKRRREQEKKAICSSPIKAFNDIEADACSNVDELSPMILDDVSQCKYRYFFLLLPFFLYLLSFNI